MAIRVASRTGRLRIMTPLTEKVLRHRTRRQILRTLNGQRTFLRDIARALDIPPSTAAYHLKRLLSAGLVEQRRGVYHSFYFLTEHGERIAAEF
ncbi:MAG: winged helix-turn-helix domain-containing protein [Promethearchaeota archaeon]